MTGSVLLRSNFEVSGRLVLTAAHIESLVDEQSCWPNDGKFLLDGLTYGRFGSQAPTTAEARAKWLLCQSSDHLGEPDFKPQPWRQAIKVLRDMGHEGEARKLAIRFEQQRRKAGVHKGFAGALHDLYGMLSGYGHSPMRLLLAMVMVWLTSSLFYQNASDMGVMAPTNPLVFEAEAYQKCRPRAGSDVHWNHSNCTGPNEYTTFSPLMYSLDLILPLVDLQQDKDWSPMVTKPITPDAPATFDPRGPAEDFPFGHFIRIVMWFEILFGWVVSLLFVAILSGLIKKAGDE